MLGVSSPATDFEAILGSRNAGDRDDMEGYLVALVKAGVAVVLTVDPADDPANPKRPLDHRSDAMKLADVRAGRAKIDGLGRVLSGWNATITTPKRVADMWAAATAGGRRPNIGLNIGLSRLIIVDLDNAGDREAFYEWWDITFPGVPRPPVTVRSPGKLADDGTWEHKDGGHIYLWVPAGVDANSLPPLSENLTQAEQDAQGRKGWSVMAGDGRGVLIPPSVRPEGPYVYTGEPIPTAPMEFANHLQSGRRQLVTDGTDTRDPQEAAWEDRTTWADLLSPHGWTPADRTESCGCPLWTRPGKAIAGAKSAVAHEVACGALHGSHKRGALHIYSDAGPAELRGEKTFSKLAFAAAMSGMSIPEARRALGIDCGVTPIRTQTPQTPVVHPPNYGGSSGSTSAPFIGTIGGSLPTATTSAAAAHSPSTVSGDQVADGDPVVGADEANSTDDGSDSPEDATAEGVSDSIVLRAELPDGTPFTLDLGRQVVTSRGIVDEVDIDPTSPFGVQPISNRFLAEREEAFFGSHPTLRRIYAEAYYEQLDPWALLLCYQTNLLSHVPSHHVLPTRSGETPATVGRGGSLNQAAIIVATSTAGKSEVLDHANVLCPPKDSRGLGVSTGQSLLREFVEVRDRIEGEGKDKKKISELVRVRDSVSLLIQEATQLFAENDRAASPTFAILRQATFGQNVSNGTSDRNRFAMLRAGTYRFTMLAACPATVVGPLFTAAEMRGGSTGRFAFSQAGVGCQFRPPAEWRDEPLPTIPVFRAGSPSAIQPPELDSDAGVHETMVVLDPVVIPRSPGGHVYINMMNAAGRALSNSAFDDGFNPERIAKISAASAGFHMPLMWLRMEAAFAIMFGAVDGGGVIRPDLSPDCALRADDFLRVHRGSVAYCWKAVEAARETEAREQGELLGHRQDQADVTKRSVSVRRMDRLRARVVKYLRRQPGHIAPRSKIQTNCFSGKDERLLTTPVLQSLIEDDVLMFDGARYSLRIESHAA